MITKTILTRLRTIGNYDGNHSVISREQVIIDLSKLILAEPTPFNVNSATGERVTMQPTRLVFDTPNHVKQNMYTTAETISDDDNLIVAEDVATIYREIERLRTSDIDG